jgi:hypothetical protein
LSRRNVKTARQNLFKTKLLAKEILVTTKPSVARKEKR